MKNDKKTGNKKSTELIKEDKTGQQAQTTPLQPAQQPTQQAPSATSSPQKLQLTPEQMRIQEEMNAKIKEMESTVHSLKFYPVAANEETKNSALKKLEDFYNKEDETIRQLLLYMLHETLTASFELRLMHTFEYFKMKNPGMDPNQIRMNVYRAMFNYHTSIEGIMEVIKLLGRLDKGDDAAKLLTYHFSHLCAVENEGNHMLRSAILKALGESNSIYALNALINYAEYTDNERTFNRVVSALKEWDKKLDKTKLSDKEKEKIRVKLKEHMSKDMSESHYG